MLSNRFVHTAMAFFVLGVGLGMSMCAAEDLRFTQVHAHSWLHTLGLLLLAFNAFMRRRPPRETGS